MGEAHGLPQTPRPKTPIQRGRDCSGPGPEGMGEMARAATFYHVKWQDWRHDIDHSRGSGDNFWGPRIDVFKKGQGPWRSPKPLRPTMLTILASGGHAGGLVGRPAASSSSPIKGFSPADAQVAHKGEERELCPQTRGIPMRARL